MYEIVTMLGQLAFDLSLSCVFLAVAWRIWRWNR